MIDTHCHLTDPRLGEQLENVLERALKAGVQGAITVSTSASDVPLAQALAEANPRIWFTTGIHPLSADENPQWEIIQNAASHPRCVAWGELGLDGHYPNPSLDTQRTILEAHLEVIGEFEANGGKQLPIIVHCRDMHVELIEIFRASGIDGNRFVFHCFNASPVEARMILDLGSWISFTGIVTFATAPEVAEAAKLIPADRIMVETDAPYLSPEPLRKVRPCEPAFVVHTAERLAALRGVDTQKFAAQLDANAARFFDIEIPQCA
ncbi:MAG: TatD family hydrolase [Phycisphaerales bacterium]|nr:TatD family hydrolase [Phycisphaerales bacterium]